MIERKRRGEKIHTSKAILNYQRSLLRGEHVEWTCMAGYKLFFVSAPGEFLDLQHEHTDKHIMDVTLNDLYANYRNKSCQEGCGVYCAVSASLLVEKPVQVLGKEIVARADLIPSIFRRSLTPDTDKAAHSAVITNQDGAHEMNGSANGGPSADDGVTLRKSVQQKTTRQYPNVNVSSSCDQSESTVERGNIVEQAAFSHLRPASRKVIQ